MALQQALVTINGFLGSDVQEFGNEPSHSGSMFRLGSTRRYQDKSGEWRNLPTTWITVKAFRTLGQNAAMSLRKGDPVVVTGLLSTENWQGPDGSGRSRMVLDAQIIGHDLSFGISNFKRPGTKEAPHATDARPQSRDEGAAGSRPGMPATVDGRTDPASLVSLGSTTATNSQPVAPTAAANAGTTVLNAPSSAPATAPATISAPTTSVASAAATTPVTTPEPVAVPSTVTVEPRTGEIVEEEFAAPTNM
ncbi:single-stranded DNA-binding protein [Bifidobacterium gallicum]|uniref:Single-strand binding family protein n=1 Tax=Bifidobacterium gallicum DSM 20093 = LMG 11596 TaxID=561180 RepID=D1NUV4_9BIFI|nr:single-stranded DNA-binding protein [Bifidobacterium gallicum]EFA22605.1 single-strand binding family protein [Bifidobacterium gallicum DSM 20093 = LMG 11596]KFI59583.1 single-strand binding protein [Bifidobacterium gallicum DSM 20093 = LMG 11596]